MTLKDTIKKMPTFHNDLECVPFQREIENPYNDMELETFEIYECPSCNGHFLVEGNAVESIFEMWCPYCKQRFRAPKDLEELRKQR